MKANTINEMLVGNLPHKSHLEEGRRYLGMSSIADCAKSLYFRYSAPNNTKRETSDQDHWYCWTGYLHEAGILSLLGMKQITFEIIAPFDNRFRGHTDHEMDDTVVDVKSTNFTRFQYIKGGKIPVQHIWQMQAYMRYAPYEHGVLIYVARDVPFKHWDFPFLAVDVFKDDKLGFKIEQKAKRILEAIDRGIPPYCNCPRCKPR